MFKQLGHMINTMYPFWAFITGVIVAQLLKPLCYFIKYRKLNLKLITAAGGFPSSHSAGVVALSLATGLQEKFNSTVFAITIAFAVIVIYDAANVRYYAGKNIQITKQIIKDLKNDNSITLNDEIYDSPIKDVLGHKWSEVFGGIIVGFVVAIILFIIRGY
ncbi:MAG: divergent PAP2 family protein [Erysipelotrichaceae bacterium]|nr:divergent PAP2 family protein [Erysipelotrichaceae bacterium]